MWAPTHIQVTVQRAKGLLTKGKNGTNNCFVTIGLGKEKYQTSVKEKAETNVNWSEECELKIPDQGNRAELVLTCLHRNNLGIDEFLGQVTLPLIEMDHYDRPRSKWFKLESKPGKEKKNKERGELEVRICFVVKSGSLTDLSKKEKHKSSIGQLASSVGGSLLSIGQIEKRKGIKKFAKSLGSKMHLHSKKKNKDGDDISYNGSLASIDTPNSSNGGSGRRFGQRAGEADPGVISEDEDEFVFDNLSHKSSGSSLNIARNNSNNNTLQTHTNNYVPQNPSPLLGGGLQNGKFVGKKLPPYHYDAAVENDDEVIDSELAQIENDFSVRTRNTLPAPSKPPRTPQLGATAEDSTTTTTTTATAAIEKSAYKQDEWEKKLYGGKHLEIGSSDSLKRRSWGLAPVPLPTAEEEEEQVEKQNEKSIETTSTEESEEEQPEVKVLPAPKPNVLATANTAIVNTTPIVATTPIAATTIKADSNKKLAELAAKPLRLPSTSSSPEVQKHDFNQLNSSFAKFEQRNKSQIYDLSKDEKLSTEAFINQEQQLETAAKVPQVMPRNRAREFELKQAATEAELKLKRQNELEAEAERKKLQEQKQRAEEDARLEAELQLNEQRLQEEEQALKEELRQQQEEQKRREAKRLEEDQRILNFAKFRANSVDDSETTNTTTPEVSPKERMSAAENKREKRLGKFKYFGKRDKNADGSSTPSPKSTTERIIIGHEKSATHAERRSEISAALSKKYDGKSREELMLIANGMENEALHQRQRVKELEDYLDNLLLRVMETHPKILQNPYSRTTSAKSFKNYINMNDFL